MTNEQKRASAEHNEKAVELVLRAASALLSSAPMRSDATTRAIADQPGAHFAVTATPAAVSIDVRAGEQSITVFRRSFSAPATFGDVAAATKSTEEKP